jgi:hypothetical protein
MKDKFLCGALFRMLANISKEIVDFTIYLFGVVHLIWGLFATWLIVKYLVKEEKQKG